MEEELTYKELAEQITPEFLKKRPLSASSLKAFEKSPRHYLEYLFGDKKASDSMTLGTVVDIMLLEPEKKDKIVSMPKFDKRTKQGKEDHSLFMMENKGRVIIEESLLKMAKIMVESIESNYDCVSALGKAEKFQERVIFKHRGIPCIAYRDIISSYGKHKMIIDLKTTKCSEPEQFSKDYYNLGYHIQTGFYVLPEDKDCKFANMVIENKPPYNSDLLYAHPDTLDKCRRTVDWLIGRFAECLIYKQFDMGYEYWREDEAPGVIQLPRWAKIKGLID